MSRIIPGIYDCGIFRPLVPVELEQGRGVEIGIPQATPLLDPAAVQAHWQTFVAKMESLSDGAPVDGFSNRDHDRLLYGE